MQLSINPTFNGFVVNKESEFTVSNCSFNGAYSHGTKVNGKSVISGWTKRFVSKLKYKL